MSHKRFNRHEVFDKELMEFHSKTIIDAQDDTMEKEDRRINNVVNMLFGIWDGFLYDSLLEESGKKLSPKIHNRVKYVVSQIALHIDENGESLTQIH